MPYLAWKSFSWDRDTLPVFQAIKDKEQVFFLDTSLSHKTLGRYSFFGFEPFYILKTQDQEDPAQSIRELFRRYNLASLKYKFPFLGGAVGYFSYNLGLGLEKIKCRSKDDLRLPGLFLGFYDTIIAIDHFRKKLIIFSSGFPETGYILAKKRAGLRIKQFVALLSRIKPEKSKAPPGPGLICREPVSNFTHSKYLEAVGVIKEYIRQGDAYQVNLSQRFHTQTQLSACRLYSRLRQASPSSFSAYIDCGGFQILSSSPERFLHFDGETVTTRPMKGTRPRSRNRLEDRRLRRELLESPKDKAELIMIVDLLRNDLGRVCEYGSVKVNSMRTLEAYSTVYQTTATIQGRLHPDKDRLELIRACFPGGSITGCPKIRSIQIIEEVEPCRRDIYTGSLGYLSFHNTMDLNILIRTMLKKDDKIYFHVGGGIVADSIPENEYQETLVKARGILRALDR